MSVVSERPRNCLPCKVISGFGLIGMGLYVLNHARKFKKLQLKFMNGVSMCLIFLGTARLLDIPPFPLKKSHQ